MGVVGTGFGQIAVQTGAGSGPEVGLSEIGTSIAELADLRRKPFGGPTPNESRPWVSVYGPTPRWDGKALPPTQESSMTTRGRLHLSRSIFILLMEKPHDRKTQRE